MRQSKVYSALILSVSLFFFGLSASAANTDPNSIWPLCGRITDNPPVGWVDTDGCPAIRAGDANFSDEPVSSTFGPRPLASESNRYDFHRGVDIATPIGTPFFAISDGSVEIAGINASYSDPLVKLRHFRPGESSCSPTGCYHSYYLHINSWVVANDEQVVKGQLLGYTGASGSGFEHVHFEVRDAPDFDVFSAWSRDAIHPFSALPYLAPNNTTIVFNDIDLSAPGAGRVDLTLTSNRFDLVKVSLAFYDSSHLLIAQSGNTPDANGYLVQPASFDMEDWNFMYSHKDSTNFPWANFGTGGTDECPYHTEHGASYSASLHMDAQQPGNSLEGLFNGLSIRTQKYWPSDVDDYEVNLEFQALDGPAACVEATALFASGDTTIVETGDCSGTPSTSLITRGPYLQMQTDDSITVHWRTDVATDSVVRFGASAGNLINTVTDAGSRTDHSVVLNNLGADQHYWYSVGDSIGTIAGDSSYHFFTAPIQGDPADSRIWVLGDSGTANSNARAVRDAYKSWSASNPANIVLMLGDNAYNDGTDAQYQAAVFDTYPEILRQLPLWSALGNHDGHSADSNSQTGPYYDIFNLPAFGEIGGLSSGTEAYYSFDYANIHFVCLDSYETDRSVNGAMMTWLENDLAMNTQQPWVVAFWHHPPYTKGSHNSDTEGQLIDMRENALPLLEDMGVDLILSGHSHSYERSYLLDGHYGVSTTLDPVLNVLNPGDGNDAGDGAYEKPDTIAASGAGAVYAVAGSSGKVSIAPLDHPAMYVSLASLGSMLIDVSGNRMDVVFLNQAGSVLDDFTILKGPDLDPPLIASANAEDATHVLVNFNETLDATEAAISGNFSIAGLSISNAELLADASVVRLTTSAMTSGSSYTLSVDNVQDLALNTILSNSQTNFDFFATMSVSFQDGIAPSPAYDGTVDAYIREVAPDTSYGLNTTIQVDGSEPSGAVTDMNTVLGWDISNIPSNATVVSADIQLEVTNISSGPYECYSLLGAWDQTQVTWNSASTGVPWGAPGASSGSDRGTQVACSISAPTTGPLTVNLTTDGLALVQSWIANPSNNHGLVIANPATSDGADFHSSESATAMARPKLNVTYSVPVTVNNDPVAGFSSSCTDLDCDFTDSSSDSDGTIASWAWDFGDSTGSSSPSPSHTYTAGTYTVQLTVTDNDGATDTSSQGVTVTAANVPPTAGFSSSCTDLDCNFTDSSSDSDGTIASWSWDFGDSTGSSSPSPSHTYTAGTYTVQLTVTDNGGLVDLISNDVTVSEPAGSTDYPAVQDLPSAGTVSGTFANTLNDDSSVQVITERESGGKKRNRYSYLSHTWRFNTGSAAMVTFMTNAWSSGSNDGDTFDFAWSSDNSNFNPMFTVSSSDTANVQSAVIAASGVLYVRVTDTDQTAGNRELNSISVDQMFIRGDNTVPTGPPDAPLNLQTGSVTSGSIALSWQHDGTDEQSFDVERSPAGSGSWAFVDSVAGGSNSYVDTTVAPLNSYDYRINAQNTAGTSSWSNTATGTTPDVASISLNANGYKVKGKQKVDLSWTGTGASVEIIRDGTTIATPSSQSSYTDHIDLKGGATYVYKVCNAGTPICSANVVVIF